jgi:hypothetical protein
MAILLLDEEWRITKTKIPKSTTNHS